MESNGDEMSKIAKEGVELWKELTEGNKESGREEEEEADSINTSDNVSVRRNLPEILLK